MERDIRIADLPEGLLYITEGYIDYAKEVISNRALVDLRDGMKPVQRRLLYTAYLDLKKTKGNRIKCQTLSGNTMGIHPHGDGSIYLAGVLMTDNNGSMALPLLDGQGNFGAVYKSDPPAAPRYTEWRLHPNSDEYFKEMHGINFVPNYDGTLTEPELLPVSYPAVLCNVTSGIAVGFKSNIPSFNFNDVLDLTLEYIEKGECTTTILPDFVTKGYYVKNNKELDKLMRTGKATLKLRGRVEVAGKELNIVEYPYGITIQGILKQINKANIYGIRTAGNLDGFDGANLYVDCTAKNRVDEVLYALYKDTDLQYNFQADLTTIINGKPLRRGVWGIVEEWVKWRRLVLLKEYAYALEGSKEKARECLAFMEIMKYPDKRDVIVDLIVHKSDESAVSYILDNFDNNIIDRELAKWITTRRINQFRSGGKYAEQYKTAMAEIKVIQEGIDDIDKVIVSQLKTLKATRGRNYPRQTEITTTDYDFQSDEKEAEIAKDMNDCVYYFKDGFLKKLRYGCSPDDNAIIFDGVGCDTLVAIDNRGRVLRVYCDTVPYTGTSELGIYLPRYFELDESDDYKIWWIGRLDGLTKMIVYTDGNVGFLDTSEWEGLGRRIKVIEKGIAGAVADKVGAVMNVPDVLYVIDTEGKIGLSYVSEIKQKERTAKTRVFNLTKGASIASVAGLDITAGSTMVMNAGRYIAPKLQYLESDESFIGDINLFKQVYN